MYCTVQLHLPHSQPPNIRSLPPLAFESLAAANKQSAQASGSARFSPLTIGPLTNLIPDRLEPENGVNGYNNVAVSESEAVPRKEAGAVQVFQNTCGLDDSTLEGPMALDTYMFKLRYSYSYIEPGQGTVDTLQAMD